jgi:hypothetical protein
MSISNYAENKFLDTLRNQSFAVTTVYAQLHTGDPGEDGTANVASETTRVVDVERCVWRVDCYVGCCVVDECRGD